MYNYAKRLVVRGHHVTWLASSFSQAKSEEIIDGIHVIRRYSMHTIWIFAWMWYKNFKKDNKIDIILDEAGGWPILSPLYEKKIPIFFFVHHIGDEEFQKYWIVGKLIKKLYKWMFYCYKNQQTITVSNSTRQELISEFGFEDRKITVIENACDVTPLETIDFTKKQDSILFVGRLMPIKRVEDAIRTFAVFRSKDAKFQNYILDIVWNNQDTLYVQKLNEVVSELSLEKYVHFAWYIEKEAYSDYITSHKVILVPSVKEWFWLVVLEANSYGIPAIGYDVAGLRDSIKDSTNGYLIENGDYEKMGEKLALLCGDIDLYQKMSIQSLEYVKTLWNWDQKTDFLENSITPSISNQ
jgi:glycosyltransferase involved in cell wall biosynthesis